MGFTELQTKKVSSKELAVGCIYQNKQQENLVYIGRYDYYSTVGGKYKRGLNYNSTEDQYTPVEKRVEKKYIFWDIKHKKFIPQKSLSLIALQVTDIPESNIVFLIDDFFKTKFCSKMKELKVTPVEDFSTRANVEEKNYGYSEWSKKDSWSKIGEGLYEKVQILTRFKSLYTNGSYTGREIEAFSVYRSSRVSFENEEFKLLQTRGHYDTIESKSFWNFSNNERKYTLEELKEIKVYDLLVILENGVEVKIDDYSQTY